MDDVRGVRNLVGTGLVQLVGGVITAVVGFAYLVSISPMMTLLTIGPLGAFAIISTRAFQTLRPAFRERGKIRAEVTGRLTESLGGIRVIKGFHAVAEEGVIFRAGVMRIFDNVKKTLTTSSLVTSSGTFFMGLAGVLVMGYGGWLIVQGQMTVGGLFSFTFLLGFLIAPVIQMANIGTQMTEAFAGLDRTAELLSWPTEDDDPKRLVEMPSIAGRLRFQEVHFRYEEDKPVLQGISFDVEPGTVVALVGSSGSGKSTMASLAASFLTPDEGQVLVDGIDLSEVQLASYRTQLGLVLQDDFLFDGTISENLLFARPTASAHEVEHAARQAYVTEFSDRFPDGARHHHRRARGQALGRTAPARYHRPRDPRRPQHPLPGRSYLESGHRERSADPGLPRPAAQGAHDACNRPPPVHNSPRRPHPRAGGRPDR